MNVISKGSQAPRHNQLLVSLAGLGAEQVDGVKLRTFYLFIFKIFFFLTWTIFKVFTQLVTTLLLFYNVLVYGPEARGGSAP